MRQFSTYNGEFPCHSCNLNAVQSRLWYETKDLTWKCGNNHITRVKLARKRPKK